MANLILLAITLVLSISLGAVFIPPLVLFKLLANLLPGLQFAGDWPEYFKVILIEVRLPHTALIALTGAALAGSGAAYQGLFRNPLADPYLIGVASGAGLGAVAVMSLHWPSNSLGHFMVPLGAFLGALLTVLLVYNLARTGQHVPLTTLILAGVAVGSFAVALTSFLMLRADEELHRSLSFLLGGSPVSGWEPVLAVFPYMLLGLICLSLLGHSLNVLQFGEEQAQQLGLPVNRVKTLLIITASLTAASAVAFSGIIGFVGLIVPHLMRLLWGPDYRKLIPLSIIGGSSLLLLADMLARVALAPQSLPVGVVTSLVGAPFFLWILHRAKRKVFW